MRAPPPAPVVVENVNFDSITLMRWTVDNEPHSWPLKKVGPILWDGYARFDNVSNGGLWLSANADGKTYWGQAYDSLNRLPYQTKMDRPGSDIQIQTKLDGIYRVRFNAQTRAFRIEAASTDATETMPADTPEQIRTWTDTRGRTVEAKLISVKEASVLLENASGAILEVPLNALSPDDQAYAKERRAP
ncbi:MAG: SHD1 domain-containing protein [Kiritimatiellae bacterium]|nr:SHD1 domain-containing protein [Kiritimatiellia bacterium]